MIKCQRIIINNISFYYFTKNNHQNGSFGQTTIIIQKIYLSSKMITTRINYENCIITCICCLNNIIVYSIEGHIL